MDSPNAIRHSTFDSPCLINDGDVTLKLLLAGKISVDSWREREGVIKSVELLYKTQLSVVQ